MHAVGGKAPFWARTGVGSYPTALVEDFKRLFSRPNVHFFANQGVRHAVIVLFEGDMVINMHAGTFPERKFIGLDGQGG